MYDSLVEWCRFPVYIHDCTGITGAGDKTYAPAVSKNGYRIDEMRTIQDKTGAQYVSFSHVYFPETVDVTEDDMLSFPDEPVGREIRKVSKFYDGTIGTLSIKVVYL